MQKANLKYSVILLAFFSTFMVGCSSNQMVAPKSGFNVHKIDYDYYTAQPQDTIDSVAKKFKVNVRGIIESNSLRSPYKLKVGQRLRIPVSEQTKLAAYAHAENWVWPSKGKIVKTFFEGNKDSRGIDIVGRLGQPIVASVAGEVVYSGAGLHNYGNLIVIKHNERFLTAYGFIKNSLVKEGMSIQQGEKIAEMGTNSKGQAILHFEIRENSKTVDPLLYLKVQ